MPPLPADLQEIIEKLRLNRTIEGVLLIGSLTKPMFNPASDYDIVLFLHNMPSIWYVGVTTINTRFTDLIFVAANLLPEVQNCPPSVAIPPALVPIIRWIAQGTILIDRNNTLQTVKDYIQTSLEPPSVSVSAAYQAWFGTNYNLAVIRRLARSTDPLYQTTADIRMAVYGHSDLWFNYFTIRKLPLESDKAALRYLQSHDQAYLSHYQPLSAPPIARKKLNVTKLLPSMQPNL